MATTVAGPDLLAWLTGTWSVARDINDGAGAFHGRAEFTPAPGGTLRWHETGELTIDGRALPVTRTLAIDAAGEVSFDDGRHFHHLAFSGGACDAFHPCAPDEYAGRYETDGDDRFTVVWHVVGPGRDDTLRSTYTRLPGPAR